MPACGVVLIQRFRGRINSNSTLVFFTYTDSPYVQFMDYIEALIFILPRIWPRRPCSYLFATDGEPCGKPDLISFILTHVSFIPGLRLLFRPSPSHICQNESSPLSGS